MVAAGSFLHFAQNVSPSPCSTPPLVWLSHWGCLLDCGFCIGAFPIVLPPSMTPNPPRCLVFKPFWSDRDLPSFGTFSEGLPRWLFWTSCSMVVFGVTLVPCFTSVWILCGCVYFESIPDVGASMSEAGRPHLVGVEGLRLTVHVDFPVGVADKAESRWLFSFPFQSLGLRFRFEDPQKGPPSRSH